MWNEQIYKLNLAGQGAVRLRIKRERQKQRLENTKKTFFFPTWGQRSLLLDEVYVIHRSGETNIRYTLRADEWLYFLRSWALQDCFLSDGLGQSAGCSGDIEQHFLGTWIAAEKAKPFFVKV